MKTKNSDVAHRAWKLVRLALLWTRKGGVLRDRIVMDLRLLPKYFKRLRHQENNHRAVYYGERQLSFDETPIFRHKMHRPSSLRFKMPQMPCIKPQVDFDYDFDYDYNNSNNTYDDENNKCYYNDFPRKSSSGDDSLRKSRSSESTSGDDEEEEYDDSSFETFEELHNDSIISYRPSDVKNDHENEIDLKAEKFIATFYEQMKLQRQTSYLQYN
ncbi:hypothetical protein LIER_37215 [Lithospermum erythrorhizon]|uniref:Cotton fiber protein n=1 Tax=Lithospermum erythrorhizon TaxID=34254 RepID=A0AAV3PKZ6_LITER